jgi:hypothetical protein
MDIHPPHGPINSIRDFLLHLLTITIGILIALSLEGIIQWTHHRQVAHEAEANLATEIRDNQREITTGLQGLQRSEQQLKQIVALVHQLQSNRNTPLSKLDFTWTMDELHGTSWNTATATGALSYMDYAEVKRYTRIYDLQKQFLSVQERGFESAMKVDGLITLTMNKDLKKVSDAQLEQAERAIGLAIANALAVEDVGRGLNDEYAKFLAGK